ncbi:FtsX-like permease family protein [Eggerthellaceae bacterium zg-893]|nr:FtsX-like permease family protein [Eggerthellaceae bacterium zg-893]
MGIITTLSRASLKSRKRAFVGLGLLLALAAFVVALCLNLSLALSQRIDDAIIEAEAGDVYGYDLRQNLDDDTVAAIEALPEVAKARANDLVSIPTDFPSSNEEKKTSQVLYGAWESGLRYNVVGADGATLDAESAGPADDETYVTLGARVQPGTQVGDTLKLQIGDQTRTLTVAGFVEDPQLGTPFMDVDRYVVSKSTFAELDEAIAEEAAASAGSADAAQPIESVYAEHSTYPVRELQIDAATDLDGAPISAAQVTEAMVDSVPWASKSPAMLSADTLKGHAMMVTVIGSAVLGAFASLLYLIALVICVHTVSAIMQEDYRNMGILRAVGVRTRTLTAALLLQFCGVGLIALLVGAAAATLALPPLLPPFASIAGVLAQPTFDPLVFVVLVALLAIIAVVVTVKARRINSISVLVALRSGSPDVAFRSRAISTISGTALNMHLTLRAIASQPKRYLSLLVCSLVISAFLVITTGLSMELTSPNASRDVFGIWKSDVSALIVDNSLSEEDLRAVIDDVSPVESSWQETFVTINVDGESRAFLGVSDFSFIESLVEGAVPRHDNEIVLGEHLAQAEGLAIGDEFAVEGKDGEKRTFLVVGTLSSMFNAGFGNLLTRDAVYDIADVDPQEASTAWQFALEDHSLAEQAKRALEDEFGSKVDTDQTYLFADTEGVIALIVSLFVGIGAIMGVIALIIAFLSVALMSTRLFTAERRDLGIYRAVGFTARQLRIQFGLRFLFVSAVGCVLGTALAIGAGPALVSALFGMFGRSSIDLAFNPLVIGALLAGLALVFFASAYAASRVIRTIDVRELVTE